MLGKAMPTSPVLARALDRTLAPVSAARPAVPVGMPRLGRSVARRPIAVRAESKEMDFDAFLTEVATKWDKTENKAVVGGYVVGTAVVILLAEYLMHLPVLNVLLGFPVQLLGLLCLPWLGAIAAPP